jgi:hypothetical protein
MLGSKVMMTESKIMAMSSRTQRRGDAEPPSEASAQLRVPMSRPRARRVHEYDDVVLVADQSRRGERVVDAVEVQLMWSRRVVDDLSQSRRDLDRRRRSRHGPDRGRCSRCRQRCRGVDTDVVYTDEDAT